MALTRKDVLFALDLAADPERARRDGGRLRPQYSEFSRRNDWLTDEQVVGYGFPGKGGYYSTAKGAPRVAVYVESDEKARRVQEEVAPASLVFPGEASAVEVEVVNIGQVNPMLTLTNRMRPCQPGVSISHHRVPSGTLGALVRRRDVDDEATYILSCNHVLAHLNRPTDDDRILQPGSSDRPRRDTTAQRTADVIADLTRLVTLVFHDSAYLNKVDAGLARVRNLEDVNPEVAHLGHPRGMCRTIRRGMQVTKCGRTSAVSTGTVSDPAARLRLRYPVSEGATGYVGFTDIVLCTPFSNRGDSGAAVLTQGREIAGLVMAGSDRVTVFCKIEHICNLLDIDIMAVPI